MKSTLPARRRLIRIVAVLMCGKPGQAFLSVLLTLFFWFPGVIHAIMVVNQHKADKRHAEMLAMMQRMQVPPR